MYSNSNSNSNSHNPAKRTELSVRDGTHTHTVHVTHYLVDAEGIWLDYEVVDSTMPAWIEAGDRVLPNNMWDKVLAALVAARGAE
jgi:hypothetical protein